MPCRACFKPSYESFAWTKKWKATNNEERKFRKTGRKHQQVQSLDILRKCSRKCPFWACLFDLSVIAQLDWNADEISTLTCWLTAAVCISTHWYDGHWHLSYHISSTLKFFSFLRCKNFFCVCEIEFLITSCVLHSRWMKWTSILNGSTLHTCKYFKPLEGFFFFNFF